MCRVKDSLQELDLSICHVDPRDKTQDVRLVYTDLYLMISASAQRFTFLAAEDNIIF